MFAMKILRKFESLGLGFIRDELDGLIIYLNNAFGEENFKISKEYLLRLKKIFFLFEAHRNSSYL